MYYQNRLQLLSPERQNCWLLSGMYPVRMSAKVPGVTLLTPRCRALLEKLTGLQLVKKFPAFYGTWRFITALTSVCHLSLSWASPIESTYPHPTSWRSILILSTHLRRYPCYVFAWCWNLDAPGNRSETPGKFWNVVLEKDGEDQLDRSCEKWRSVT